LTQHTGLKKLLIAFSAIPITIVANAARVAVTGVLANFVSVDIAEGFFHTFSGWLIFIGLEGRLCTKIGR
jgi:exosortase/archaeosortase family protein